VKDLKELMAKQNRKEDLSDFNTDEESQKKYDLARINNDAAEVDRIRKHLLEKATLPQLPHRKPRPAKRPFSAVSGDHQPPPSFSPASLGPVSFPSSLVGDNQPPPSFSPAILGPVSFPSSLVGDNQQQLPTFSPSNHANLVVDNGISAADDLGLPPSSTIVVVQTATRQISNAGLGGTLPLVFDLQEMHQLTQQQSVATPETMGDDDKEGAEVDEEYDPEYDDFGGHGLLNDSDFNLDDDDLAALADVADDAGVNQGHQQELPSK